MSDWIIEKLSELADFQKGKKVETSEYKLPGYVRYLGASSLDGGHDGYATTFLSVQANEKDVLMLWDGERSGLVGHNLSGVVSSTVARLSPNGKITGRMLFYYLLLNFEWIQNRRTGTGVPHVPKDLSRILQLKYPSEKNYQKKIVSILETIDQTINKIEALIHKYQQIKAGLMHDLFTRGVTADGKFRPPREEAPELYKETPIGWIPKEWDFALLDDIVNRLRPITYGILMPGYGFEGGIPVVKVKDIQDRKINFNELLRTSPRIANEYQRSKLKAGDVLLTIRGTVGRICIVPEDLEDANITQDTARIDLSDGDNEFYSYYFETDRAVRHFSINTLGVAVKGINLGEVRKTPIPKPSMNEQKRIVQRMYFINKKIDCEIGWLKKLRVKKSGLMQDLLTGKVRVKADQEGPAHV